MSPATEPPRRSLTGAIVPALAAAGLAGLVALFMVSRQGAELVTPEGCITGQLDSIGGPINLVDVNGGAVTQADFASGPAVVYFGFTHCPDICPTTMYLLAEALQSPGGQDIQPILITVDPERDTPSVMDAYVGTEGFPAGLVGLTGTPQQVRAAADAFKVVYQKAPIEGETEIYNVDHTSFLYVMDERWRTMSIMPTTNATPEAVAACINVGLNAAQ